MSKASWQPLKAIRQPRSRPKLRHDPFWRRSSTGTDTYVIQAVFTSLDVAEWLKNTLRNTFGHEAEVNHLTRQTPNGPVETYVVLVTRNVVALALQTGLVDRRKQQSVDCRLKWSTDPSPKSKRHGAAPSWPVASCPIPVRPASWKSLAPRKRPPWPCVAWPVV